MNNKLVTLVIGASERTERYSNMAIRSLLQHGHEVLAIGSRPGETMGISWGKEKREWDQQVDTITLYINPRIQQEYYDYILSLNPRRVIFNPGTENPELMDLLQKNGIEVVPACTLVMLSIGNFA
ncbi:MAG: CoA-binding protein [Taibaiella sp.]|nr:CoA-binding protein [Taibaiella sp.]